MARKISGTVTSDKGDKTIVVTVTRRETHPIYGKSYLVNKKFAAHDEKNEAKKGDEVIIAESKPISKSKRFVLEAITKRGHENVEVKKTVVEEEIDAKLAEKEAARKAEKEAAANATPLTSNVERLTSDETPNKEAE